MEDKVVRRRACRTRPMPTDADIVSQVRWHQPAFLADSLGP
ncbi:MAG TPA: hypothetical protein VFQ44_12210 [Streptosporangiaceae bacterium]|nr:hypothetical protein [Streptosporangiaceae bacterium]